MSYGGRPSLRIQSSLLLVLIGRDNRVKSGVGQGALGQAAGTQKSLSLQLMKKKEESVMARRVTGLIKRYLM